MFPGITREDLFRFPFLKIINGIHIPSNTIIDPMRALLILIIKIIFLFQPGEEDCWNMKIIS